MTAILAERISGKLHTSSLQTIDLVAVGDGRARCDAHVGGNVAVPEAVVIRAFRIHTVFRVTQRTVDARTCRIGYTNRRCTVCAHHVVADAVAIHAALLAPIAAFAVTANVGRAVRGCRHLGCIRSHLHPALARRIRQDARARRAVQIHGRVTHIGVWRDDHFGIAVGCTLSRAACRHIQQRKLVGRVVAVTSIQMDGLAGARVRVGRQPILQIHALPLAVGRIAVESVTQHQLAVCTAAIVPVAVCGVVLQHQRLIVAVRVSTKQHAGNWLLELKVAWWRCVDLDKLGRCALLRNHRRVAVWRHHQRGTRAAAGRRRHIDGDNVTVWDVDVAGHVPFCSFVVRVLCMEYISFIRIILCFPAHCTTDMGASESKTVVNNLAEVSANIAMSTMQDCSTTSSISQEVNIDNKGWNVFGRTNVAQSSVIDAKCYSDVNRQTDMQNKLIDAIKQAATSENVSLLGAFGNTVSSAEANLTQIVRNNITFKNIQQAYNEIQMDQKVNYQNSGVSIFSTVDISQGSQIFAAATLKEMDNAKIFNDIANYVDQQAKSTVKNPFDIFGGIGRTLIIVAVIAAAVIFLYYMSQRQSGANVVVAPANAQPAPGEAGVPYGQPYEPYGQPYEPYGQPYEPYGQPYVSSRPPMASRSTAAAASTAAAVAVAPEAVAIAPGAAPSTLVEREIETGPRTMSTITAAPTSTKNALSMLRSLPRV